MVYKSIKQNKQTILREQPLSKNGPKHTSNIEAISTSMGRKFYSLGDSTEKALSLAPANQICLTGGHASRASKADFNNLTGLYWCQSEAVNLLGAQKRKHRHTLIIPTCESLKGQPLAERWAKSWRISAAGWSVELGCPQPWFLYPTVITPCPMYAIDPGDVGFY